MRQFLVESKVSLLIALATSTVFGLAPISSVQAAAIGQAQSNSTVQTSGTLVAYDNSCLSENLTAGDTITLDGETYTLEQDGAGLFIEYVLEGSEDEGVGTYSVMSFGYDCETVNLQQIGGIDSLVGSDVDE
ncbi:MAG: hypothetical protein HY785_10415 [Oscillatoriophycideae cyanobacterium NC_groundwater_1537_Pr4_S-0.65um_50_18]|nr:hypothetical protein [Oscillatoriophycideae cyanobacterium NC_groundwater_1537_Pr4_S-0.65um_50_18]